MPGLTFADFSLENGVLEIRFDESLLLWDRAGVLWSEFRRTAKNLKSVEAEPNRAAFKLDDRFEFHCTLTSARALDTRPDRKLEDLRGYVAPFFDVVRKALEVEAYTRVGCRITLRKDCRSLGEASEQLLATGLIQPPKEKFFGLDGQATNLEAAFRLEKDGRGVNAKFKSEERKIEFTPPPGTDILQLVTVKKKEHKQAVVIADLDYYQTGIIRPDQLDLPEWMKQVVHMNNRDLPRVLEAAR